MRLCSFSCLLLAILLGGFLAPSIGCSEPLINKALKRLETSPPVSGESFDFVVIGDSRPAGRLGYPEVFKQMLREANILRPAFVFDCGDLILGGAAEGLGPQWDEFEEVVSHCEVPFLPGAGNHDISDAATEKIWLERMGPTRFHFRIGNSLFIALNTEEVDALPRISDEQVAWLKNLLETTDAEHIFLFVHKPYFLEQHWDERWSNVAEVLRGHPVRVVFGSDWHLYRDCGVREGVHYVVTGGGGAPLDPGEETGGFHHYLLVSVRGDQFRWAVVRPGSVLPSDIVTADRVKEIESIRKTWVATEPIEVPFGKGLDRKVKVRVHNPYDTPFESDLTWTVPQGWSVEPPQAAYSAQSQATAELEFHIRADTPDRTRFPVPALKTLYKSSRFGGPVEVDKGMDFIPTASAPKARQAVATDGQIEEWSEASPVPLLYPNGPDPIPAEDLQSQVRFMWDEDHFYLCVETEDDEFCQPYAGDIVWLADNVELFIDRWSWSLSLTEKGSEVFLYWGINRSAETVNTEVRLGAKRDGKRVVYEAAFPKDVVVPLPLNAGTSTRFSLIMNDLDCSVEGRGRHWLELTPGAGSGNEGFPRYRVNLVE